MDQIIQKKYFRIMLGKKSIFAKDSLENNWIGAGWKEVFPLSIENELCDS